MPGGEIDVGLVVGIAPDFVGNRRVHIFFGGVEIFFLARDFIGERRFGDADADLVLHAPLLSGRGRGFDR